MENIVKSQFIELSDTYDKNSWENKVINSGLSETEISEWRERIKEDMEAEPENILSWFREAGFSDVDIIYKYFQFAVLMGRKI
jgi:tRNA (cmo5U34)-methyltransferase